MGAQIIAITNQKGGVGKTTTTFNLGVGLAQAGKRVLLVDADPQGSLTISTGIKVPDDLEVTLATLMQYECTCQQKLDTRFKKYVAKNGVRHNSCRRSDRL